MCIKWASFIVKGAKTQKRCCDQPTESLVRAGSASAAMSFWIVGSGAERSGEAWCSSKSDKLGLIRYRWLRSLGTHVLRSIAVRLDRVLERQTFANVGKIPTRVSLCVCITIQ